MSSWLSVGKSFQQPKPQGEGDLQVQLFDSKDIGKRGAKLDASLHDDASSPERSKRKKSKSSKEERKSKHHKKEKKRKRKTDKDGDKHSHRRDRELAETREDDSSSSSGFSSSDEEGDTQASKSRKLLKDADILDGSMALTYLPNGEVVILPRRKEAMEEGAPWSLDRRADRDMLLYEGMHPRDVVEYIMLPSVPYVNESAALSSNSGGRSGHVRDSTTAGLTATVTSSQLYRASQQRPSGLMVSALKQHRDYEGASKTAQIFLHRQMLLTERRRELRLHHKHRYHSTTAKTLLEDPTLRRLDMRGGVPKERISLSVAVSLPLPYVDADIVSELGFAAGGKKQPEHSTEYEYFTTTTDKAQIAANALLRETNQRLRDQPHSVEAIRAAVSAQDTVCILQRLASGRPYNRLLNSSLQRRNRSKADAALQKDILDRKVDILKRVVDENQGSSHTQRILRQQLIYHLHSNGHTEEIARIYASAKQERPLDTETQLAGWAHSLGVFHSSACAALVTALRGLHSQVSLTARNRQAAGELQQLVDASLQHPAGGTQGSALQRQYRQLSLEADLQRLRCDALCLQLMLEQRAGHRERAVAIVQAMLDMNMQGDASVEDFCAFWDTECARLGEDVTLFPPAYLVQGAPTAPQEGPRTGYGAWVRAGRPEECVGSQFAECGPSDDCRSICARLGVQPDNQQAELLRARREAAFSVMERLSTSAQEVEAETEEVAEESALNEAAADLFLSQVLGSAESALEAEIPGEDSTDDADATELQLTNGSVSGEPALPLSAVPVSAGQDTAASPAEGLHPSRREEQEDGAEKVAVEENGMVYSRLHGYKIKVSAEDSGRIYRKILSEIAPEGETAEGAGAVRDDEAADREHKTAGSHRREDVFTPLEADSAKFARYRAHSGASAVQWRPLKAVSARDADAVEQQPERVIFSDDIRASLFRNILGDQAATAGSLGAALEVGVRQHLIVRCLQALGVHWRHSEVSHSATQRTAAFLQPIMSAGWGEAHAEGTGQHARQSGDHPLREAAIRALREDGLTNSLCIVEDDVLRRHRLCAKFGYDSQLNFVIRLVADILRAVGASKDTSFAPEFVTHLRVLLVELLTARYKCTQRGPSAAEVTAEPSVELQLWRAQCRAVIEASVPPASDANTGNARSAVPAVGSLEVWASYLSAEHALGHSGEAVKLADKVQKSLNGAQPVSGAPGHRYPGHSALVLAAALQLALDLPLAAASADSRASPTLTKAQVKTAVCLLVQYAHSGALRTNETSSDLIPKYGSYEGELKPAKKAEKSKGGEKESSKLSAEAVRSAVEIYQNNVLVLAEALQEDLRASDRVRAEERRCEAVRVESADCGNVNCGAEICQLVSLMAWLQYLSCQLTPVAGTEAEAVQVGDEVFSAAISLLRGLVLRSLPPAPQSDATQTGHSQRGKGYSHHLRRLLGEVTDTAPGEQSLAELCAVHGIESTSSAEVAALVAVERLHECRLQLLLAAYAAAETSQVRERRSALFKALHRAKSDFPCNAWFQRTFVTLTVAAPGGGLALSAYFKEAATQRWLWSGGQTPAECIDVVRLEVLQAHRSVQLPLSDESGAPPAVAVPAWADLLDIAGAAHIVSRWSADAVRKVRTTLENMLSGTPGCQIATLWLFYIHLEASFGRKESAKKVFFRAVNQCGWSQDLYVMAVGPCLKASFTGRELRSLESMLEQRGVVWLRACPT